MLRQRLYQDDQHISGARSPASTCPNIPDGDGWLHEIKHDGHRLVAIVAGGGQLKLISRNGYDRTPLFRGLFRKLAAVGQPIVLDGEIAVPDERGVTQYR